MENSFFKKDTVKKEEDWPLFQSRWHAYGREIGAAHTPPPEIILHTLQQKGKEWRAQLVFLTAQLLGSLQPEHHALAGAIEYLHTASLLHDDVLDGGILRRGSPCAHEVYGNTLAILSGDWWLAQSLYLLLQVKNWDVVSCVQKAMVQLVQGQMYDCQRSHSSQSSTEIPGIAKRDYLAMIGDKTASLFSAAALASAMVSSASSAQATALEQYARAMGMAYQLQDDALEYQIPVEDWDGGHDFFQKKITLPWIIARESMEEESWRTLLEIQEKSAHKESQGGQGAEEDLFLWHHVQRLLRGAVEETNILAERYKEEGIRALLAHWSKVEVKDLLQWGDSIVSPKSHSVS